MILYIYIFGYKPKAHIVPRLVLERVVILPDLVEQAVIIHAAVVVLDNGYAEYRRLISPLCTQKVRRKKYDRDVQKHDTYYDNGSPHLGRDRPDPPLFLPAGKLQLFGFHKTYPLGEFAAVPKIGRENPAPMLFSRLRQLVL